jgi:hypothetical protein
MEKHLKYTRWSNRDDFEISDSEELDILLSRTAKSEFLTIEKEYKRFEFRKPKMIVTQLNLF